MRVTYTIYIIFFILLTNRLYSQDMDKSYLNNARGGSNAGYIKQVSAPPAKAIGTVYLFEDWFIGDFFLKGNDTLTAPIRYDIKNFQLEVKVDNEVRAISGYQLKGFKILNPKTGIPETFINSNELKFDQRSKGFIQILEKGELLLVSKLEIEVIPSNYNAALDAGQRSDKYVKKEKLLLIKGNEVHDITKTNKKLLSQFGEKSGVMEDIMEKKDLSFKKKEDLIKIIGEYNKLVKS